MRKFGSTLLGAAGLLVPLFTGQAHATLVASGGFSFQVPTTTLTPAGDIAAGTTSKTLSGTLLTGAASTGNLNVASGSTVALSTTTLSILSGVVNFTLSVPTIGGALTFTFTSQTLNTLTPTNVAAGASGTGSILDTITGTLTADTSGTFTLGAAVTDTQSCSQPVVGSSSGPIACSDSLVVAGTPVRTPEPSSLALLGSTLVGFALVRRRRKAS
jgi:hypothetical protein